MKLLRMICDIISDILYEVLYFVENNLRNASTILEIALPYAMLLIGQVIGIQRGKVTIGGEVFIPIVVGMVTLSIRKVANKLGKGTDIPIPSQRFTEVDGDEVSIDHSRIQELLLYMSDLEDWIERKGLM